MRARWVAGLLLTVLVGCLGPRPDRSRFFTLTPLGDDEVEAPATGNPVPLTLGLGPIVLPGYLDRVAVVRRAGPNQIVVSETDRWAEPLGDSFARTLGQNLGVLLPTDVIVRHPWPPSARPALAVGVEVRHFEANGEAELIARWHVRRVADGTVLVARESRIVEPVAKRDTAAAVAALSRTLEALGREMAVAVRSEQAAGHDRTRR